MWVARALAGLSVAGVAALGVGLFTGAEREAYGHLRPPVPCLPSGDAGCLGPDGFVEYIRGDLPLVISVPHGGQLNPAVLDDRTGSWGADHHTIELGLDIAEAFITRTGRRPSLVLSHLHRRKLDPNRELFDAARGNPRAIAAWQEYHDFVDHAIAQVRRRSGSGLYIDLHGHSHEKPRVELGYLLDGDALALENGMLDERAATSSLATMLAVAPGARLSVLVRGPRSLGTLLDPFVPTVPSARTPDPGGDPFYAGGYSTRRHTASIPGLQVETPFEGVRDTREHRQAFAAALTDALIAFAGAELGLPF